MRILERTPSARVKHPGTAEASFRHLGVLAILRVLLVRAVIDSDSWKYGLDKSRDGTGMRTPVVGSEFQELPVRNLYPWNIASVINQTHL